MRFQPQLEGRGSVCPGSDVTFTLQNLEIPQFLWSLPIFIVSPTEIWGGGWIPRPLFKSDVTSRSDAAIPSPCLKKHWRDLASKPSV